MLLHRVLSITISDLQVTTNKRDISINFILIMDLILMKYSMVISDTLYILPHFNLNFIPFLLLMLSCSITIVHHLRLDYCENFELA